MMEKGLAPVRAAMLLYVMDITNVVTKICSFLHLNYINQVSRCITTLTVLYVSIPSLVVEAHLYETQMPALFLR